MATHRNFYDCFDPTDAMYTVRLFGSANVGNFARGNLQIGGQLTAEEDFVITNWYARSNVPWPILEEWAHMSFVELVVAGTVAQSATLHELFHRAPGPMPQDSDRPMEARLAALEQRVAHLEMDAQSKRKPVAIVPGRQYVYAVVTRASGELRDRVRERLHGSGSILCPLVWIHLAGLASRTVP